MEATFKRRLAIGAAGLAVVAGAGGAAYAAGGDSGDDRDAFLDDVAQRLGVSRERLDSALRGAFSDRLDAAVKAGRLTREQADELERRASDHDGGPPFVGPPHHRFGPPDRRFEPPRPDGPPFLGSPHPGAPVGPELLFQGIDAASEYLDLTPSQLRERLSAGKSLAEVARDRGKSVDGLKRAIESAVRANLDDAVDDERLTGAQRDRILKRVDEAIDAIVERRPPERPPGPSFRWHP